MVSDRAPAASHRILLSRVAAVVGAVTLAFAVVILLLDAVFFVQGDPGAFLFSLTFVILVANLAIVGGLLASRRPENPIGWLLLTAGLFEGIGIAGSIYARLDAVFGGGRFPLVVPAAWLRLVDRAAGDRHPGRLPADRLPRAGTCPGPHGGSSLGSPSWR